MAQSVVSVLRTRPRTVLADVHRCMNLAGYQDVLPKDIDTALKINISWHFFFPGSSTTPWQLEGVIRGMLADGYPRHLVHACHNRTVVIDAHLGERENKQLDVVQAPLQCLGCNRNSCPRGDHACMRRLEPSQIVAAARGLLP